MTITEQFGTTYKRKVIFVLFLIYVVNYADRMIIGVIGEAIKLDLGISDTQLGLLGGTSFTLLYVLASFPVGRLVERVSRVRIIWIAVALWSGATAAAGFASTFAYLLLCRAAVGVGEGSFIPAVLSLLSDYFPPNKRASAYSTVVFGLPLGGILGAISGGWIATHYGWEMAFFVVGIPGLILAIVVARVLREPPRGHSEPSSKMEGDTPSAMDVIRTLFKKPAFLHMTAGASLVQIVAYAIALFMFPYFSRTFNMSFAEAGVYVGMMHGLGTGLGILAGGYLSDFMGKRDVRWYAWMPALTMVLITPFYLLGLSQSSWMITLSLIFIPTIAVSAYAPTVAATTQGLVEPRMRGTTAAISSALIHIVSLGMGATLTGFMSDYFANQAFTAGDYAQCANGGGEVLAEMCKSASALGLKHSLMAISVFLLWSSTHFYLSGRTLKECMTSQYSDPIPDDTSGTAAVYSSEQISSQ